jgi:signal transduction histidine kinase
MEPGRRWREGGSERGGGPPEVLSRLPVETPSGPIGEVLVLARPQRFPMWPPDLPRPILLTIFIAVFVAGAAGLIMFRVLLRRLRALEDLAARVAGGDLDARVPDPGRDEIGRLGARLNHMTESLAEAKRRIEESDRGRRQLLADISHELATPLTSIRGYAETLLDPSVPVSETESAGYLQSVLEESMRMDLLIGDLLDLTRLEAGAVNLSKVRLDWTELSRNVMKRFDARFRQAGLAIEWSGGAEEAWVWADGRRIEQVIENLLVNALRYVPAGGRVTLAMERVPMTRTAGDAGPVRRAERGRPSRESAWDGQSGRDRTRETPMEGYCLTVEDDGPGFPAEDLPHVFDRFYRADAARSSGGSGLGLAIVKEIILLHGGEVRVGNRTPSGASIHVTLPVFS